MIKITLNFHREDQIKEDKIFNREDITKVTIDLMASSIRAMSSAIEATLEEPEGTLINSTSATLNKTVQDKSKISTKQGIKPTKIQRVRTIRDLIKILKAAISLTPRTGPGGRRTLRRF